MDTPNLNKEEELPFLDQLLENPVKFSVEQALQAVSDAPPEEAQKRKTAEDVVFPEEVTAKDDSHKHTFCSPMMMMSHQEMVHRGIGSMRVGGDMSKGMIMYMDGFRFAMAGGQPCLNLYFPSWTLDTRWKFLGALLLVFALSFGAEAVSKFRHKLTARPVGRDYQAKRTRQMIISGLHGMQALLGYVVMLATMTFSLEILLSVVLGLSYGYYYYFAGEVGLEGHVTTNPCCNYMQDESDEHEQRQQQQQQAAAAQSPTSIGDDNASRSLLLSDGGCCDTENV